MSIATITANPSIDRIIYVDSLRLGSVNNMNRVQSFAGGKGINVSNYLADLGTVPHTFAFLGGENGKYIQAALCARNIPLAYVELADETRANVKLVDESQQQTTEINAKGPYVRAQERREMLALLASQMDKFRVLVIAGSLPRGLDADFYRKIIGLARQNNIVTILDTSGENLQQLATAKPDMVKPNQAELELYSGRALRSIEAVRAAGRELIEAGVKVVLVSMGSGGSLLLCHSDSWLAKGPEVDVINTVGAGDSMVAAFARAMAIPGWQEQLPDILRQAAACSLAAISRPDRKLAPDLIAQLATQVQIEEES